MTDRSDIPDRKELLAQQFDAEEEEMIHGPSEEAPIKHTEMPERERDASGKFVSKAKEPEGKEPENEEPAPVEVKAEDPPLWARPPKSWKKEQHTAWEAIDPKVREYIHAREDETRAGVEPLIPKAKFADEINKVIEPYLPTIKGLGVEPKQAIGALLRADHALRTLPADQKRNFLFRLAADYGVNLAQPDGLAPLQAPASNQVGPDPRLFAVQNEVTTLKGLIAQIEERAQEREQQSTLAEINSFAKTHEFFEEAKEAMTQLLQSGMASDLNDAYEKAIRLDSTLFEKVQAKAQHAQVAAKHNAAQKAKAAAVSPRSATPGSPVSTKAQDRRSMLHEQFGNLSDRL